MRIALAAGLILFGALIALMVRVDSLHNTTATLMERAEQQAKVLDRLDRLHPETGLVLTPTLSGGDPNSVPIPISLTEDGSGPYELRPVVLRYTDRNCLVGTEIFWRGGKAIVGIDCGVKTWADIWNSDGHMERHVLHAIDRAVEECERARKKRAVTIGGGE